MESPLQASMYANLSVREPSPGGVTRRLWRGRWGCHPEGVVLSFDAKESTKESQRHGDYGKKPFIAHFDGGARNVARNLVG